MKGWSGAAITTIGENGQPPKIIGMHQGQLLYRGMRCDREVKDIDFLKSKIESGLISLYIMKRPCEALKHDFTLI
jgi:hypothetical protein